MYGSPLSLQEFKYNFGRKVVNIARQALSFIKIYFQMVQGLFRSCRSALWSCYMKQDRAGEKHTLNDKGMQASYTVMLL